MSSLSFGVMSRKVGQSPGSDPLVQPNTGHCRGFSRTGPCSPLAADVSPPTSAAARVLLAALLLFFPFGIVVVVTLGGPPLGCCAADASEYFTVTTSSDFGDAGRLVPLASGGPSGSVESMSWLSLTSSDITSDPIWRLPTVRTTEVVAPGGPCPPLQPSPRGLSSPAPTSLSVPAAYR
jgi:hypothetical protein